MKHSSIQIYLSFPFPTSLSTKLSHTWKLVRLEWEFNFSWKLYQIPNIKRYFVVPLVQSTRFSCRFSCNDNVNTTIWLQSFTKKTWIQNENLYLYENRLYVDIQNWQYNNICCTCHQTLEFLFNKLLHLHLPLHSLRDKSYTVGLFRQFSVD